MADEDKVIDSIVERIQTNFESKPETVQENKVVEVSESTEEQSDHGIIRGGTDLTREVVYSHFGLEDSKGNYEQDNMITTIMNFFKGMETDEILDKIKSMELAMGAPGYGDSRLKHFYRHIRIQEAIHEVKDNNRE